MYHYSESSLLVVPENGNSLNEGISFSLSKFANSFHYNFRCQQSIIDTYGLWKRMIFQTMTFRFPYANEFLERHFRRHLLPILSLLQSTTVAGNQAKWWASIFFSWESLNNRWVPSNIPMNTTHPQCVANAINHLPFLKIAWLSVAIIVYKFVAITFSRL